jgi:hypothetical protein
MAFKRSIPAPTRAQQQRQDDIRELGCCACLLGGHGFVVPEIHHLNSGGRNMGQDYTVGLCAWHHRGIPPEGMAATQAELILGPSFARTARKFRERYGAELELLEAQNAMLATYYEAIGRAPR